MRIVPPRFGVDTNERLDPNRLLLGGVSFVCRYLSDDGFERNLTSDEARTYAEHRIDIVTVWENGKSEEVLQGKASGVRCAKMARAQQRYCGGAGQPIYFAVDFWPTAQERPAIVDFFSGVASVIGRSRTGAYGPPPVMSLLFDTASINYGWQSNLWRTGDPWHPRAQLQQYLNADPDPTKGRPESDHFGAAGYVCYDHAVAYDFGQWRPEIQ